MSKTILGLAMLLCSFLSQAQPSKADLERSLSMMEKQGQIRREGNKIIFLHQRPGDTAFLREMYNKMLEKVDPAKNPYTIAFDIGPQYKNNKPAPKTAATISLRPDTSK